MADLQSIIKDPNFVNANAATKQAIFDKHAPNDPNYANANEATKEAIRNKFGLESAVKSEIPGERSIADYIKGAGQGALNLVGGLAETGMAGLTGAVLTPAAAIANPVGALLSGKFGTKEGVKAGEQLSSDILKHVYQPKTAMGQQMVGGMGEAINALGLPPIVPELLPFQGAVSGPAIAAQTKNALAPVVSKASNVLAPIQEQAGAILAKAKGVPTTPPEVVGVGAAETGDALLRQQRAASLRVPIPLTKGQATRERMQQQFENEIAKTEVGQPLASAKEQQNLKVLQNFDEMLEGTGAQKANEFGLRETGKVVDSALVARVKKAKEAITTEYEKAKAAGETAQPVSYKPLADYINQQTPTTREKLAPILNVAQELLAKEDPMGTGQIPINKMEDVYKAIGKAMGSDSTNITFGSEIKNIIKDSLDASGGDLYKTARKMHSEYAKEFKNQSVLAQLLDTKRNTTDRKVAYEDVWNKIVNAGSKDDLQAVGVALKRGGPEGEQAWRELIGQTIVEFKKAATPSVSTDSLGNRVVSPSKLDALVRNLDSDGKLEYLLGKKGAQEIRDLRDTVIDVQTSPSGTVNFSNTSSAYINALDRIQKSAIGQLPLAKPTAEFLKQRAVRKAQEKQVEEALNYNALAPAAQKPSNNLRK